MSDQTELQAAHELLENAFDELGEVCEKVDRALPMTVDSRPEVESLRRRLAELSEEFQRARRALAREWAAT